jgi:hypothetical protein
LGSKSAPAGHRRGLTLPVGWKVMVGPVLAVEGPSDVLAGRAAELRVIGRPSNIGGVEYIAHLCQHLQVIVIGDNDQKPDGRWPGKEGAERLARQLEAIWGRPVHVAYPPEGIKDLRDWVCQLAPDWQKVDVAAIRQTILDAVQPPSLLLLARPCDTRGRAEVKVFRLADGVEAAPIHSDRLHIEDAAARKRFVKAVVKTQPTANADDLHRRLLSLKVPAGTIPQSPPAQSSPTPPVNGFDHTPVGTPPTDASSPSPGHLPEVLLPGGATTILSVGQRLGQLLSQTDKHFSRGGVTATIGRDKDRSPILEPLRSSTLASVFETVAQLMRYAKKDGTIVSEMTICSEQEAKLIQHSTSFQLALPPIHLLSPCPVLVEQDGTLVQISGYNRKSGILSFGESAIEMPLEEAVNLLSDMLSDFRFATSADRARALAAIITPAMVFGNLLIGRAPVDLGEADASQTGKGYRNKITAFVYHDTVKTITQKKGGVGSLEETFATALIQGRNFISFDNVRGEINSPALESFLTEDSYLARVPHMAAADVDPRRVIVQFTSNKADITTDLANRSSCVRILKQPEGYRFRQYPEGSLLEHVGANQPRYLGAVFAVVRAWYAAGKPHTDTTAHDFRAWATTLDWILQNIFKAGPLLEGHRETQIRMATPVLNWLRDVALAVRKAGYAGVWLRTVDLAEIVSQSPDIKLPGLPEGADMTDDEVRKKVLMAIGQRMSQCFGANNVRTLEGFKIQRQEKDDREHGRVIREYCFEVLQPLDTASPCKLVDDRGTTRGNTAIRAESAGDSAAEVTPIATGGTNSPCRSLVVPLSDPPVKMAISPVPPVVSEILQEDRQNTHVSQKVSEICADTEKEMECTGGTGGTLSLVAQEAEVLFTARTPAEVLIELHLRGICITLTDGHVSLEPSAKASSPLLEAVHRHESMLREMLSNPRRRWKEQTETLLAPVTDLAIREDLLHLFDEREAIASLDGCQSDDLAGELAYRELVPKVVAVIEKNLPSQGPQAKRHQLDGDRDATTEAGRNDCAEHQEIA